MWGSLITIPEPEGLVEAKPKSSVSRLGRRGRDGDGPLAAGAVLVLAVAWVIAFWPAEVRPIPKPVPPPAPDGFVALFNGKDLAGWRTHPSQPGSWRVENGVLIGSGPRANGRVSHLYTERGDYKDFQLRVKARASTVAAIAVSSYDRRSARSCRSTIPSFP